MLCELGQLLIAAALLMLLGDLSAQEPPVKEQLVSIASVYPHLTMHNDEKEYGTGA